MRIVGPCSVNNLVAKNVLVRDGTKMTFSRMIAGLMLILSLPDPWAYSCSITTYNVDRGMYLVEVL